MRKTKIVCTIGPATESEAMIEKLTKAGMNVARLNFSHGSHKMYRQIIKNIRKVSDKLSQPVAIIQDLAGPKIRIGEIPEGPITLESGDIFTLTSRDVAGDQEQVSVTYKSLPSEVSDGDTLLLNDGALEFVVEDTTQESIRCRVIVGGKLSSNKGINLPNSSILAPILSEKDHADIEFGLHNQVDYISLSYVRTADDVECAFQFLELKNCVIPIIAKIEKHEALTHIDDIIELVDGIMIARGDLGVEIPIQRVPRVQKMLINKANLAQKPIITATQLLKSMVDNPRPTRAEVTDVANAILDGSDALMLSEESAIGQYPIEAVNMLSKIAADVEQDFPYHSWTFKYNRSHDFSSQEAVAQAACHLAEQIQAKAIITCTQSGSTTVLVSKRKPPQPILALTPDPKTFHRLCLVYGAYPILMDPCNTEDEMEMEAIRLALQTKFVNQGDSVVLTAGLPLHVSGATNLIRVLKV